ncbi:MAG: 2-oxoglutarate dehydrogenase E1 component, partial [Chlamydiales bacterium]|nr:2-oxoglutarate dehydrogenase E1 component [Chlamydiales bacterium]
YVGQTRFSLEGGETMIPVLLEMIKAAGQKEVEEIIIGMAHRGRLNVLAQVVGKPYSSLLEEFENDLILSGKGHDDVKYHMGFSKEHVLSSGKKITVSMAPNPSHLESVDPVVLGQVRALQVLHQDDQRQKIMALLIHGDAALAGQGVIYETLQLMNLPSYSVGGTIHLVVNNQIGYTTTPNEGRSTHYCTDIAKAFGCPVFHVNGEDPESCVFAAELAIEIRQKFQCDVFIDLLCYRKYGHNEGDEPSYTQPLEYQTIRAKTSIPSFYTEKLLNEGFLKAASVEVLETQFKQTLSQALETITSATSQQEAAAATLFEPLASAVDPKVIEQVVARYSQIPETFHVHSKLKKWLQDRFAGPTLDWAAAECLAFGSLLLESISIRLAGQDAKRGTFSQRHLILVDEKTSEFYSPLEGLGKARLDVVNTPLTEYAGMAFEYGYSWSSPQTLVLWEAQYGDFNNGAQIIIDQYLVSAEHKWGTSSSLTLLLPHAYEGAGPEHSSARLERFLQLSAEENIQVVNASTPAQYFHVLRRQAKRTSKRPLILFTPKSLLRSPANVSSLNEFTSGCFQEMLNDPTPQTSCTKLLLCSGKIFYELYAEKMKRQLTDVSILRIEQLYPFHHEQFNNLLMNYKHVQYLLWVQEEPENAGAWNFIRPCIEQHLPEGASLVYIGRPANPTTATGSHKKHKQEQLALIEKALGAQPQSPLKDSVL